MGVNKQWLTPIVTRVWDKDLQQRVMLLNVDRSDAVYPLLHAQVLCWCESDRVLMIIGDGENRLDTKMVNYG